MADDVKWIKFKVGMFDGQSFKRIKRAKIGGEKFRDKLTAVWFELMDLAGKCNHDGAFIDNREMPYGSYEDIATMIDRETEEVELCMQFYLNEGMIEIIDDVYMLTNWLKYQNAEGLEKIRAKRNEKQAKWREKKKALAAGADVDSGVDPANTPDVDQNGLQNGLPSSLPEGLPSYSYSISNSISNSNSLIEEELIEAELREEEEKKKRKPAPKKPEAEIVIDYTGLSDVMVLEIEKWLQYKKERRENYKPTGLQALVSEIRNNVNRFGERAVIELIEKCMASNWRGIIFDKLKQPAGQQTYQSRNNSGFETSNPFLEMMNERRGEQ